MRYIDLTHTFTDAMPTYPGDPESYLRQIASIEKDGYADHKLETTIHVGTHIDAPAHMIKGGKQIDELPLEAFRGDGTLIDARGKSGIGVELLLGVSVPKEAVILLLTGFSRYFREPRYFGEYPAMTESLAEELVKWKIKMVGFDTPSPDRPPFAVHKILLNAGILIIENLTNLESLLEVEKFEIQAFPIKLSADAAPARVVARC